MNGWILGWLIGAALFGSACGWAVIKEDGWDPHRPAWLFALGWAVLGLTWPATLLWIYLEQEP